MHPYARMGTLRSSDTKAKTEETLPWVTKSEYGMDFFEAFEKNRDAKRFIHIHIPIFDGKVEKIGVHDLLKSELVHDPSLQEIAVFDSFTVRCSASYESDTFYYPFQDIFFPFRMEPLPCFQKI